MAPPQSVPYPSMEAVRVEGTGYDTGVAIDDYDNDGHRGTNDSECNFLFHNTGYKFEEVAFPADVALTEDGQFVSGMVLDFRDFNNDGHPDIAFVALANQTFPFFENTGKGDFREITSPGGMRPVSLPMSGSVQYFMISIATVGRIFSSREEEWRRTPWPGVVWISIMPFFAS